MGGYGVGGCDLYFKAVRVPVQLQEIDVHRKTTAVFRLD